VVVTRRGGSLFLVRQVDHGGLAGEIAAAWGNDTFEPPTPRDPARLAAALHDEGWRPRDDEPACNATEGRPLHFLEIPMEEHIPLYRSGVHAVAARDAYAGLLVGMHWTGLYRGRWGLAGGTAGLLRAERTSVQTIQDDVVEEEEARWASAKRRLWTGSETRALFETRLWHNYELLQAWDLLSLYLCVSVLDTPTPAGDPVPLASTLRSIDQEPGARVIAGAPTHPAGPHRDLVLRVTEPGVVRVQPYPFAVAALCLSVEATVIPDRRYSADELPAAFRRGDRAEITCEVRPA
jgi:hypothetical protein